MKKVLILAYDYPPYISVGALRPKFWAENFHKFGVYPIVITRNWNPIYLDERDYLVSSYTQDEVIEVYDTHTLIKTPYLATYSNKKLLEEKQNFVNKFFSKLNTGYYEVLQFIAPLGTKYNLYKAAEKYLKTNTVDLILATGEPFILFKYASKLSVTFDIPWIADYRDLWTDDLKYKSRLLRNWNRFFENKYLRSASKVTTVSKLLKSKINGNVLKDVPVAIVKNGFVEIDDKQIQSRKVDDYIITYAGSVYNWHPVEIFLDVFVEWKLTNNIENAYVQFIGSNVNDTLIAKYHPHVFKKPKMEAQSLFCELKSSSLLLLFNDYSISGTKIYDYLIAKRYIILCFEDDPNALKLKNDYFIFKAQDADYSEQNEILLHTQSGVYVKDDRHLKQIMATSYKDFKEGKKDDIQSFNVEEYSRINQLKVLAGIIHDILK